MSLSLGMTASEMADRYVCRRQGHRPVFTSVRSAGIAVTSYLTSCQVCGKVYEAGIEQASASRSSESSEERA